MATSIALQPHCDKRRPAALSPAATGSVGACSCTLLCNAHVQLLRGESQTAVGKMTVLLQSIVVRFTPRGCSVLQHTHKHAQANTILY